MKKYNENISYIVASDVNPRDGIGIEIYIDNETDMALEIFRDDTLRRTYVKVYKSDIDLTVLENAIKIFKNENIQKYID